MQYEVAEAVMRAVVPVPPVVRSVAVLP